MRLVITEGFISSYAKARVRVLVSGKIHSTFATSFNVLFDGLLLNVSNPAQLSCLGVSISENDFEILKRSIEIGGLVKVSSDKLVFYTVPGVIVIDLTSLTEVAVRIPSVLSHESKMCFKPIFAKLEKEAVCGLEMDEVFCAHLQVLKSCADALQVEHMVGFEADAASSSDGFAFNKNVIYQREHKLTRAVTWLKGRGLGLTPTGDDVLAGYITGLHTQGKADAFCEWFTLQNLPISTDVSEAYMQAVLNKVAHPVFVELVQAIANQDSSEAYRLSQKIVTLGHTSGFDLLLGLFQTI